MWLAVSQVKKQTSANVGRGVLSKPTKHALDLKFDLIYIELMFNRVLDIIRLMLQYIFMIDLFIGINIDTFFYKSK